MKTLLRLSVTMICLAAPLYLQANPLKKPTRPLSNQESLDSAKQYCDTAADFDEQSQWQYARNRLQTIANNFNSGSGLEFLQNHTRTEGPGSCAALLLQLLQNPNTHGDASAQNRQEQPSNAGGSSMSTSEMLVSGYASIRALQDRALAALKNRSSFDMSNEERHANGLGVVYSTIYRSANSDGLADAGYISFLYRKASPELNLKWISLHLVYNAKDGSALWSCRTNLDPQYSPKDCIQSTTQ